MLQLKNINSHWLSFLVNFFYFILVHTYLEGADCESFWIPLDGLNCWRCGSGPFLSGRIFQVSALIEPKGTLFISKTPNFKRR